MNRLPQPARILHQELPYDGRRYTIAIPAGMGGDRSLPLVIALHWGGPIVPFIGQGILVGLAWPALEALGAIVVAPDRTDRHWATPESADQILQLLDYLEAHYRVDQNRVLITGYSLGGLGTWYMAGRHPDRFAAALPMAANPPDDALETEWKIPLYVIHGSEDELFPLLRTTSTAQRLQAAGVSLELHVVAGASHYQTDRYVEPLSQAVPWFQKQWG